MIAPFFCFVAFHLVILSCWIRDNSTVFRRVPRDRILLCVQKRIAAVNPDQQTSAWVTDLEAWIQDEPVWASGRLNSALFGGFSVLALAISAVGLYSVVSYTVAQRTNDPASA